MFVEPWPAVRPLQVESKAVTFSFSAPTAVSYLLDSYPQYEFSSFAFVLSAWIFFPPTSLFGNTLLIF